MYKRFRARARGRASAIHKHTSNIVITLGTKAKTSEAGSPDQPKADLGKKESQPKADQPMVEKVEKTESEVKKVSIKDKNKKPLAKKAPQPKADEPKAQAKTTKK